MIRVFLLLPVLYCVAIVETSLGSAMCVGHVGPDLAALVAVVCVWLSPRPRAFLAAGAVGLAADLVSPGPIGMAAACFLLAGYCLGRLRAQCPWDNLPVRVAATFGFVAVVSLALALGQWLLGEAAPSLGTLLGRALGVAVYTAGVSLPCWMVLGWIRRPQPVSEAH